MTERTAHYRLTADDAVRAAKVALARAFPVPIWAVLAVGMAVALLAYIVLRDEQSFALQFLAPALAVLLGVAALLNYVILPWQARRNFEQAALLKDEMTFGWASEGMTLAGNHGESHLQWGELHRWSESDLVLLLYHSDQMYYAVPKRALTPAQLADLLECIAASGLKKR